MRTGVCDRRDRRRRNTSHWRVRERYGHQRSPQVQRRRRSPFRPGHERTTPREAARVGVFPPRLPRALRALFHEAAGRGGRASSFRRAGAIATRFEHRRSTGRATACHKQRARAVSSGTVTVTSRRPVGWAPVPDLGWGRSPKLHGMQGVRTVFPQLSRGLRTIHDQGPRRGPLSTPRDLLAKLHPQIVGAWVQSTGDRASLSRAGAWPPCAPTRQRGRHGAH